LQRVDAGQGNDVSGRTAKFADAVAPAEFRELIESLGGVRSPDLDEPREVELVIDDFAEEAIILESVVCRETLGRPMVRLLQRHHKRSSRDTGCLAAWPSR
jgi:hypothetical protein